MAGALRVGRILLSEISGIDARNEPNSGCARFNSLIVWQTVYKCRCDALHMPRYTISHATCSFFRQIVQSNTTISSNQKRINAVNSTPIQLNLVVLSLSKHTPQSTGNKIHGNETSRALISSVPRLINFFRGEISEWITDPPFSINLSFPVACIHTFKSDLHPC